MNDSGESRSAPLDVRLVDSGGRPLDVRLVDSRGEAADALDVVVANPTPVAVQNQGVLTVRTEPPASLSVEIDDADQVAGPLSEFARLDSIAAVVLQVASGAFVAGLALAFTLDEDLTFQRLLIVSSTLIGMTGHVAGWALRIEPGDSKVNQLRDSPDLIRKRREAMGSAFALLALLIVAAIAALAFVRPNAEPATGPEAPLQTPQPIPTPRAAPTPP